MALIRIKGHPAFESLCEELRKYFSQGDGFLRYQTHLTFVCGANGAVDIEGRPSLRAAFLEHLHLSATRDLVPVLAEVAIRELAREPVESRENLGEFESMIAESVDSVLIFPEGPGSFAELGLFSAIPALALKTLVVSRGEHKNNSFITLNRAGFTGDFNLREDGVYGNQEAVFNRSQRESRTSGRRAAGRAGFAVGRSGPQWSRWPRS